MARIFKTSASTLGLAAAASMAATPVLAAEMPSASVQVPVDMIGDFEAEEANAEHHRWRRHRRGRVDAGDVIGGILVLGTIAAVASAASNNKRRDRDYRRETRDYPRESAPRRGSSTSQGTRGIDNAVSRCVGSIERDVRVDRVDNVSRNAGGWQVNGTIYNGESFSCQIDPNGKIENIAYGSNYSAQNAAPTSAPAQDRQWSNDRYAAAWERAERSEAAQQAQSTRYEQAATTYGEPRYTPEQTQQRAAYPGGPLLNEAEAAAPQVRTRVAQAGQ